MGRGGPEQASAVVSHPNRPLHPPCRPVALSHHSHAPSPPFPRPLSVIPTPPPSFLRRQEPNRPPRRPTPPAAPTPRPFPNSSLPPLRGEVRWGVGGPERASAVASHSNRPLHPPCRHVALPTILAALIRHSRAPSVIPAQAGTQPPATTPRSTSSAQPSPTLPNSSLPPSRGEVRWGVGGPEPSSAVVSHPKRPFHPPMSPFPPFPRPLRHSHAPIRHSCAGRNLRAR